MIEAVRFIILRPWWFMNNLVSGYAAGAWLARVLAAARVGSGVPAVPGAGRRAGQMRRVVLQQGECRGGLRHAWHTGTGAIGSDLAGRLKSVPEHLETNWRR